MTKEPKIGKFLDKEEELIVKSIEKDDYKIGKSKLSPEKIKELKTFALK